MHEVLINRLGGLSLPRKSVVRLTDRPDMTLDVYRGRKTTVQPFCISCNEPFTVKHFLITCIEFHHLRTKYFNAKTVTELFNDSSADKIISFLKETNPFSKL